MLQVPTQARFHRRQCQDSNPACVLPTQAVPTVYQGLQTFGSFRLDDKPGRQASLPFFFSGG